MQAGGRELEQRLLQQVRAHARAQVEHRLAELDEQPALAGAAEGQRPARAVARRVEDRRRGRAARRRRRRVLVAGDERLGGAVQPGGVLGVDGAQPHGVAGADLTEPPEVGADDLRDRDEAAEARPVGADDDRHVAGEHDRAHAVGAVEDVRRVKARLAAVLARPRGQRTGEPHAGAVGVHVDGPRRGEQRIEAGGREEVRRAVRSGDDAQRPVVAHLRHVDARGAARCAARRRSRACRACAAGARRGPRRRTSRGCP